ASTSRVWSILTPTIESCALPGGFLSRPPDFQAPSLQKNNTPTVAALMAADPGRAQDFVRSGGGWCLDFSRVPMTREGLAALEALPAASRLKAAVEQLFSGKVVNPSEGQPALHMALRASRSFQGLEASEA